jgi:hypothetical protein
LASRLVFVHFRAGDLVFGVDKFDLAGHVELRRSATRVFRRLATPLFLVPQLFGRHVLGVVLVAGPAHGVKDALDLAVRHAVHPLEDVPTQIFAGGPFFGACGPEQAAMPGVFLEVFVEQRDFTGMGETRASVTSVEILACHGLVVFAFVHIQVLFGDSVQFSERIGRRVLAERNESITFTKWDG